MSTFIHVPDKFNPKTNFWDHNYQISLIEPFNKLYDEDNSENKEYSSKQMWAIWMLSDPNPKNRIWNLEKEDKIESILFYFPDLILDDLTECLSKYSERCMTPAARAYKSEEEKLIERSEYMRNTPIIGDELIGFDKTGRAQIKPGTVKDLEAMHKNSLVIHKNFEIIKRMYEEEINGTGRVWGGRDENFREKGALLTKDEIGI